jgi:hypothetical protein
MRRLVPIAIPALLLLAACINPTADTINWHRDATSEDDARADLQACTHASRAQVDREQASQGLAGDQMGQSNLAASIDAYDQDKRVDQLTQRCMKLRGYQPGTQGAS